MIARAGYAIFPSSHREGGNADASQNSDFQILEADTKLSVEVKFRRINGDTEYDDRITVILYGDICKDVAEGFYSKHAS